MTEIAEDRELYGLQHKALEMNYYRGYYGQLIGAKVIGVEMSIQNDDDYHDPLYYEMWPSIIFEKDGVTYNCEISRDEEGNGPGFLFGLNQVRTSDQMKSMFESMSKEELLEAITILSNRLTDEPNYKEEGE